MKHFCRKKRERKKKEEKRLFSSSSSSCTSSLTCSLPLGVMINSTSSHLYEVKIVHILQV